MLCHPFSHCVVSTENNIWFLFGLWDIESIFFGILIIDSMNLINFVKEHPSQTQESSPDNIIWPCYDENHLHFFIVGSLRHQRYNCSLQMKFCIRLKEFFHPELILCKLFIHWVFLGTRRIENAFLVTKILAMQRCNIKISNI